MPNIENIIVPDIGDFDEVEVIEILVKVGDEIDTDDGIITIESDKASMEIPSPIAGKVTNIKLNIGDKISKDDLILTLQPKNNSQTTKQQAEKTTQTEQNIQKEDSQKSPSILKSTANIENIIVPDIGDFDEVEVIEILVKVGDEIDTDDGIITIESDKASMEIPSPIAGKVTNIKLNIGDKISKDDLILTLQPKNNNQATEQDNKIKEQQVEKPTQNLNNSTNQPIQTEKNNQKEDSHASPSIRKLARELGVVLSRVTGTGNKNRITEQDLKLFVKNIVLNQSSAIPTIAKVDFTKFGDIETINLSRINKLSAKHLTSCWLNIPHVTQFDEANIDEIENYRQAQKAKGIKLTPLVFIIKAVINCLKIHNRFNSSLDGDKLILKKYFNIGIAVDTKDGLVVPVIKNADQKSIQDLAAELDKLSKKARDNALNISDISGSCFTISSLGGIGGTNFTPIVNAPEVAILGVARSQIKPVWDGKKFAPKLMLPLALSYDHRVIDGASGARFITDLSKNLNSIDKVSK
jgi:pyruvate dehydrogenase E2 component (dihydrolipoamide acetyltransferase)